MYVAAKYAHHTQAARRRREGVIAVLVGVGLALSVVACEVAGHLAERFRDTPAHPAKALIQPTRVSSHPAP